MVADGPAGNAQLDRAAQNELRLIRRAAASLGRRAYVAVQVDLKRRPKLRRQVIGRHPTLSPEQDAADPQTLNGFFAWVQAECPAERHLLICWGHADGPVGLFQDTDGRKPEIETLSLLELRSVFGHAASLFGRPIDIALFKDCWFSTLEMIYELDGVASYVIASPSIVVPRYGWPYAQMFRALIAPNTSGRTRQTATAILSALDRFYQSPFNRRDRSDDPSPAELQRRIDREDVGRENLRDEVPFALLDPAALGPLGPALAGLARGLASARRNAARQQALASAVRGDPALVDITALCRRLVSLPGASPELRRSARAVLRAVDCRLIVARSPEQSAFGGISAFYFPAGTEDRLDSFIALMTDVGDYGRLKLSEATGWNAVGLENVPVQQRRDGPTRKGDGNVRQR